MVLRAVAALAACALIAGCGGGHPAPPRTVEDSVHGLAYELPQGWQRANDSLTPGLEDPREDLSVGTFPLHYRRTACGHLPTSALEDLGPDDAFLTIQERGLDPRSSWAGFPRRPAKFGPSLGGPSEASACAPGAHFTDHWFAFTDAGRHFHVLVAFGPRASETVESEAWQILDSLKVDPSVRPGWRASG